MNKYLVEIDLLKSFIQRKIDKENYVIEIDNDLFGYGIGAKEAYSTVLSFLERIKRDIDKGENT
ncbi:hypothetical protein [Lysinibacillus sp. BPa_S21]|uniref:hypothetical protein n=1 Tax=Lysinibacillus sp. BPa_S21 TaxID=2932478 RepID=UPI0020116539|nr:hypothetical protein [Lysinibacillus sp. BPa_S21]MCL1696336.1 hypothetical protein [Lysinibacillus sp. BPa_S21]